MVYNKSSLEIQKIFRFYTAYTENKISKILLQIINNNKLLFRDISIRLQQH